MTVNEMMLNEMKMTVNEMMPNEMKMTVNEMMSNEMLPDENHVLISNKCIQLKVLFYSDANRESEFWRKFKNRFSVWKFI